MISGTAYKLPEQLEGEMLYKFNREGAANVPELTKKAIIIAEAKGFPIARQYRLFLRYHAQQCRRSDQPPPIPARREVTSAAAYLRRTEAG